MKYRGVVYDVGLRFTAGNPYSVPDFDPDLVAFDVKTIARQLGCNAIRIEGEEIERLVAASRIAHANGMTVFFNPWKMNAPISELPTYFMQAAKAAEELRRDGVDIVFIAGCEMSLFNEGIFPGSSIVQRIHGVIELGAAEQANDQELISAKAQLLNEALGQIVAGVREAFLGKVSYSAGMWEQVDWHLFDLIGVDHYRASESPAQYVQALDRYRFDKPLIVMEVGCCAYEGAGKLGAGGFMRLEGTNPDGTAIFKDGIEPTRSEREQADYVEEQLTLLSKSDVDGAFIYVFSFPTFPYGTGARDLDMMSFSLVRTYPTDPAKDKPLPPWEPKEAFFRLRRIYKDMAAE